tara:strand:- start:94953 stop:96059 length:1107 start_codon:yes stop_codon:yes gene_type:complete
MSNMDFRPERSFEASAERSYVLPVILVVVLACLAGGAFYYFTQDDTKYAISASTYLRLDGKTRALAVRLNEEPCNRSVASDLAQSLIRENEYAATTAFVTATEAKCGPNDMLWQPLVIAQEGSSDFSGAEATLSRAIAEYPNSSKAYYQRGNIRVKMGNHQGAYEDFRRAIYVYSDPSEIRYDAFLGMANSALKLDRPCEAMSLLQDYVAFENLERKTPAVMGLMKDWQKQGSCPDPFGNGKTRLKYTHGAAGILLPVSINGKTGQMLIDTGASRTVLTKGFAKRAGITPTEAEGAVVNTANGETWVMGGRAEKIALGQSSVTNVPVFIQDHTGTGFGRGIDGLLGLSFLGNFKFTLNRGQLTLEPLK